jgi:hypothetical protein
MIWHHLQHNIFANKKGIQNMIHYKLTHYTQSLYHLLFILFNNMSKYTRPPITTSEPSDWFSWPLVSVSCFEAIQSYTINSINMVALWTPQMEATHGHIIQEPRICMWWQIFKKHSALLESVGSFRRASASKAISTYLPLKYNKTHQYATVLC